MVYLEGMIPNTGYGEASSSGMETIRFSDMHPRELFTRGCVVCLPGAAGFERGLLADIDPDNRLGQVMWKGGKIGWWYLKDLKKVEDGR